MQEEDYFGKEQNLMLIIQNSEVEYAYMLACANSYQHQSGGMVGTPDYNKIASEINRMYHLFEKVRSPSSIRNALFKYTSSE